MSSITPTPTPGTRRREGRGFIDSFGGGRVCSAPGCNASLSRYNENTQCALHDGHRDRS
jgi:hypothetical protein